MLIDPRFYVKSWSESNYLFNDTKILIFWTNDFFFSLRRYRRVTPWQLEKRCQIVLDILDHVESKTLDNKQIVKNVRWWDHALCLCVGLSRSFQKMFYRDIVWQIDILKSEKKENFRFLLFLYYFF